MPVLTKFGTTSPPARTSPPIRDYQRILRIESARMWIKASEGSIRCDPHPTR